MYASTIDTHHLRTFNNSAIGLAHGQEIRVLGSVALHPREHCVACRWTCACGHSIKRLRELPTWQ